MKKRKLLMPLAGIAALGSVVPIIVTTTSCNSINEILDIDSESHIIRGFKEGLSKQQIADFCKGTLTIPSTVTGIAPFAFYDVASGQSKIPASVENLVFEENIDLEVDAEHTTKEYTHYKVVGYNKLHNEPNAEFAAIGDSAFRNAPFKTIKLPVGSGYDIGESAFEGIKISQLVMPTPRYNTIADIENTKYQGSQEKYGSWRGFESEINEPAGAGNVTDYIKAHTINVRKKAFYNIPTLVSFTVSPFMVDRNSGNSDDLKIFSLSDDTKGNITYLDASQLWSPYRRSEGEGVTAEMVVGNEQIVKWEDEFIGTGSVGTLLALAKMGTMHEVKNWTNPSDRVVIAVNSAIFERGNKSKSAERCNQIEAALGYAPSASEQGGFASDEQHSVVPTTNNIAKDPSKQYAVDMLNNKEKISADVSLTNAKSISMPLWNDQYGVLANAGFKGDMEFKNIKAEWSTGSAVPLTLHQVKLEEATDPTSFINNEIKVNWEEGKAPKAGDKVLLTFDLYLTQMNRYTPNLQVEITFVG